VIVRSPSCQANVPASRPTDGAGRPTDDPKPLKPPGKPTVPHPAAARLVRPALTTALLGLAATALVACGSSGKGLIPAADAGPLQNDFEEVAKAAEAGNGNCTATREAIAKTEADFAGLPSTVDAGLRTRLRVGIANLAVRAREMCLEPAAGTTATTTSSSTHTTTRPTTSTSTSTTSTSTSTSTSTPTTSSSTTPTTTIPGTGGGTPAPSEGPGAPGSGNGNGQGNGESNGGVGAGGTGANSGQGNGQGNGVANQGSGQ
jgi:hypothetical protein